MINNKVQNKLYEFTIKVSFKSEHDLSESINSAYVNCYSSDLDHEAAIRKGVLAINEDGYIFEDIINDVREISSENWNAYITKTWPEFVVHLPNEQQIKDCLKNGMVFFSPFMGFKE